MYAYLLNCNLFIWLFYLSVASVWPLNLFNMFSVVWFYAAFQLYAGKDNKSNLELGHEARGSENYLNPSYINEGFLNHSNTFS